MTAPDRYAIRYVEPDGSNTLGPDCKNLGCAVLSIGPFDYRPVDAIVINAQPHLLREPVPAMRYLLQHKAVAEGIVAAVDARRESTASADTHVLVPRATLESIRDSSSCEHARGFAAGALSATSLPEADQDFEPFMTFGDGYKVGYQHAMKDSERWPKEAPVATSGGLWCLHLLGPDEVHAAPSKEHAERAAALLNDRDDSGLVKAVAAAWPHSAASHAEDVARFIPEWLLPGWQVEAVATGPSAATADSAAKCIWPDCGHDTNCVGYSRGCTGIGCPTVVAAAPAVEVERAITLIAAERRRQVEVEGCTPEHDDEEHGMGQLAAAAACYALPPDEDEPSDPPKFWPWGKEWWKPGDRVRELTKAGALIVAEIERLQRAAAPTAPAADVEPAILPAPAPVQVPVQVPVPVPDRAWLVGDITPDPTEADATGCTTGLALYMAAPDDGGPNIRQGRYDHPLQTFIDSTTGMSIEPDLWSQPGDLAAALGMVVSRHG